MKRLLLIAVLAASVIATGAAQAAATTNASFRGDGASAFFSSFDPSGCIVTDTYVSAFDGRIKLDSDPGSRDSMAFVSLSRYDVCTGTLLLGAWGSAPLESDAFRLTGKLGAAELEATVELYDWVSGNPLSVDVTMSWTGTGDLFSVKDHYQAREPGFTVNSRYQGSSREGSAIGSISDGSQDYAPNPSVSAYLSSAKQGYLTITK